MHSEQQSFTLWSPVLDADKRGCRFDVCPYNFVQLHEGTPSLMAEFARCLNISAAVDRWELKRFCSPYFAGSLEAQAMEDRYPLAWRVAIRFTIPTDPVTKLGPTVLAPRLCGSYDSTWQETNDSWTWSPSECCVIANFADTRVRETVSKISSNPTLRAYANREVVQITNHILQVRISLGTLSFPRDEDAVKKVLGELRHLNAAVDWTRSVRMEVEALET